jgi:hypothetical protein
MIIIALTLYLPQHLTFLTKRAWFYYNGPDSAKMIVQSVVESAKTVTLVEEVKQTVASAASADAASTIWQTAKEL